MGGSLVSYSAEGNRNPTVVINLMNKPRVLGTNSDTTTLKQRRNPDEQSREATRLNCPSELPDGKVGSSGRFARRFDSRDPAFGRLQNANSKVLIDGDDRITLCSKLLDKTCDAQLARIRIII